MTKVLFSALFSCAFASDLAWFQEKLVSLEQPNMFERVLGYMQQSTMGIHQGLFGASSSVVEAPTEKCFGKWNIQHAKELHQFGQLTKRSIAEITLFDFHSVITNTADFILANNEYCHVAGTVSAIRRFCRIGDNCRFRDVRQRFAHNTIAFVMHGMNFLNMFEQKGWFHMDDEERGVACFKVGKALGELFSALWQFDADVLVQTI